jgi:hypothetical protein
MGGKILTINELLDIDIPKFERENNIKINSGFTNMVQESDSKSTRSKSSKLIKLPKPRQSDYHLQVSTLGKRVNPHSVDRRAESADKRKSPIKPNYEKINIKKDHLKRLLIKKSDGRK